MTHTFGLGVLPEARLTPKGFAEDGKQVLGGWCFSFGGVAVTGHGVCSWENWVGGSRDSGVVDDVRSGADAG